MTTYNLNLNKEYCNHWGIWEAIREILQNAVDQQTINADNPVSVRYDSSLKMLSISNKHSTLERKTLLLGASSKTGDSSTIGQFGEGYKIALLILTKLGIPVVIKNYAANEKWIPSLKADKRYDGEEVLKVKIQKYIFKKMPDHNLSFEITGITPEIWEEIQEKYLHEHKDVERFTARNGDELLLNDKYKGVVFINGLFVEKLKGNYEFGYNLTPSSIALDRDRQSVRGWEFQSVTSRIVEQFAESQSKSEDNYNRIKRAVVENSAEFDVPDYHLPRSEQISNILIEEIQNEYGELGFPVSSQDEADTVRRICPDIIPVFLDRKKKIIISQNENYKDLQSFMASKEIINLEEKTLTPTDELKMFLLKFQNTLSYSEKEAIEVLIQKSKNWIDTLPSEETDCVEENEESLEETKENDFSMEHVDSLIPDDEKQDVKEDVKEDDRFLFDDDIPF